MYQQFSWKRENGSSVSSRIWHIQEKYLSMVLRTDTNGGRHSRDTRIAFFLRHVIQRQNGWRQKVRETWRGNTGKRQTKCLKMLSIGYLTFSTSIFFFLHNDGSIPIRRNLERRSRNFKECNKIYLNSASNYMIKFLLVAIECRLALIPLYNFFCNSVLRQLFFYFFLIALNFLIWFFFILQ